MSNVSGNFSVRVEPLPGISYENQGIFSSIKKFINEFCCICYDNNREAGNLNILNKRNNFNKNYDIFKVKIEDKNSKKHINLENLKLSAERILKRFGNNEYIHEQMKFIYNLYLIQDFLNVDCNRRGIEGVIICIPDSLSRYNECFEIYFELKCSKDALSGQLCEEVDEFCRGYRDGVAVQDLAQKLSLIKSRYEMLR